MKIKLLTLLSIFIFIIFSNSLLAVEILPVSQVKKGMTGYGKTVLEGNKIITFKIKVIDILPNFDPQSSLILVKLTDPYFKKTGVIAGMSGSPIYIHNKVIGALAYSWQFSKEPIAGVTPIEKMLNNNATDSIPNHNSFNKNNSNKNYADYRELIPIKTPLLVNGLNDDLLSTIENKLTEFNFAVIKGGGYDKVFNKLSAEDIKKIDLAGQSVAVPLVRGDLDLSAVGTITEVFGDKVLAFGHPFFGFGKISLPLHLASVKTIISRLSNSFKLGSAEEEIGKINFDGAFGISGKINSFVKLIPINCSIKINKKITKNFNYEIVDIPFLTPSFINLVINNSFAVAYKSMGVTTLKYNFNVFFTDNTKISFANTTVATDVEATLQEFTSIISIFFNQEIEKKKIKNIETFFYPQSKVKQASIIAVTTDKKIYNVGDECKLSIYLKPFGEKAKIFKLSLKLPDDLLIGDYILDVADANTFYSREASRKVLFPPKNLKSIKQIIKLKGQSTQLVLGLYLPQKGLNVLDEELTFVPQSMLDLYQNLAPAPDRIVTSETNIFKKRINTKWILTGYDFPITLKIKAKQK